MVAVGLKSQNPCSSVNGQNNRNHVTASCLTSGGAVCNSAGFHDGCEGKRSSCVKQAVIIPVSHHSTAAVTHNHRCLAHLNDIPKNGQKAERKTRDRWFVLGRRGGEGER